MQTRYHGDRYPRSYANFHSRPYTAPHKTGYFSARTRLWAFCTHATTIFLGSPSPHFAYISFCLHLIFDSSHFSTYIFVSICLHNQIFYSIHDQISIHLSLHLARKGCVCRAFSLNSTPSSVVTDPPHFLLTAHLQYLNPLRLRTGVPLVCLVP